ATVWRALVPRRARQAIGAFDVAVRNAFASLDRGLAKARLTEEAGRGLRRHAAWHDVDHDGAKSLDQAGIAFGTMEAVAAIDHAVLGNRWHRERQDEQRQQGDQSHDTSMRQVGPPGSSVDYSLRVRHKYCKVPSY